MTNLTFKGVNIKDSFYLDENGDYFKYEKVSDDIAICVEYCSSNEPVRILQDTVVYQ